MRIWDFNNTIIESSESSKDQWIVTRSETLMSPTESILSFETTQISELPSFNTEKSSFFTTEHSSPIFGTTAKSSFSLDPSSRSFGDIYTTLITSKPTVSTASDSLDSYSITNDLLSNTNDKTELTILSDYSTGTGMTRPILTTVSTKSQVRSQSDSLSDSQIYSTEVRSSEIVIIKSDFTSTLTPSILHTSASTQVPTETLSSRITNSPVYTILTAYTGPGGSYPTDQSSQIPLVSGGAPNILGTTSAAPAGTTIPASADSLPSATTQTIVGSIVGSVAGFAIMGFLIFFVLNRHKLRAKKQSPEPISSPFMGNNSSGFSINRSANPGIFSTFVISKLYHSYQSLMSHKSRKSQTLDEKNNSIQPEGRCGLFECNKNRNRNIPITQPHIADDAIRSNCNNSTMTLNNYSSELDLFDFEQEIGIPDIDPNNRNGPVVDYYSNQSQYRRNEPIRSRFIETDSM